MRLLHPFETSFGVTQDRRILLVTASDGTQTGYGEVTAGEGPYYCHETVDTAWYILSEFIVPRVIGRDIEDPKDFAPFVEGIRGHNMAKGGLEAALWDLDARRRRQPLWKLLGGTRQQIECGVSIGIQRSIDALLQVIQKELDALSPHQNQDQAGLGCRHRAPGASGIPEDPADVRRQFRVHTRGRRPLPPDGCF
jgi:O-succinylbenzoate synthase